MLNYYLGKFYESKRRKATGLKQQIAVMVAGLPKCMNRYAFFGSFEVCPDLATKGRIMYYPTVFSEKTNLTHIVKNKNYCECGTKYHVYLTFTQNELRHIKFKPYHEVTCLKCRQAISSDTNQTQAVP
jgi:hypothetical protein